MAHALAKKSEEKAVAAFGFGLQRYPGAWIGRRELEVEREGRKETVTENASAWAKADGSGMLLTIVRWNAKEERGWTVYMNFTIEGKFINTESKAGKSQVDESVWKMHGRESNKVLEREMAKLMADPRMQEDIRKALEERRRRPRLQDRKVFSAPLKPEEKEVIERNNDKP